MEPTRNRQAPSQTRPAPQPERSRFDLAQPVPDDRLPPTPEEFAAWCEHPTTRWVAAAWLKAAEAQKEQWIAASWGAGDADPNLLLEWRTRADAYLAFIQTGRENYERIIGA